MSIASELEKGKYFLVNNEPSRVTRKEIVAVGTHSHTKLKIFFQGLVAKGEKSITLGHTDKVELLDITRKQGQVISKAPGKVQVMDMVSYETLDATANPEVYEEINDGDSVTFIEFNGKAQILEKR